MPSLLRLLYLPGSALLIWFVLHTGWITSVGFAKDDRPAEMALILGNRIEPDGRPAPLLQERLDKGVELYRSGRALKLMVSGGRGVEGFEEADVMKESLVAAGVPEEDIIVDRHGDDTWLSAQNAHAVMVEGGMTSVVAVSQYFHLARTRLALQRAGVSDVRVARADFRPRVRDVWSLLREFPGYYVYAVR